MTAHEHEKVFFYCCPPTSNYAAFQHHLICLGEEFKALEIPIYSDIDHWKLSPNQDEYLFQYDPKIGPEDCSIVIIHDEWLLTGRPLPENLFHPQRNYRTVYLDAADGVKTDAFTPEFRQFDFIFRTHFNGNTCYPKNFYPWAFGLSNRILKQTEFPLDFQQRKPQILVNFRANKHPHSVRKFVYNSFFEKSQKLFSVENYTDRDNAQTLDPDDALQCIQTGGRHFPAYYKRLQESLACACFGGFFVSPFPKDQSLLVSRLTKRFIAAAVIKTNRIVQWDSWRFWEAIAAGSVVFHIDLDKYGAVLPVMPQNWKHYVGVDLDNMDAAIAKIANNPEILEAISIQGREWAREHYNPASTALRFLETVSQKSVSTHV